ncbi:MAG TPA: tRNA (adenosine(37)-N6)-dimethylallyltransferase MiaA [Kiritimatiellia bacterium]|nr:tRNA (adenosine(37)-N6)-dimethylallyltransferase MiaA [Kiritimatiellia bacterium]
MHSPRLAAISPILVGPTAVGKTDVMHCLANKTRRAIISADAMMVYRGMNIGTAKPTAMELERYSYHGIDLADPDQYFSVHDYLRMLDEAVSHDTSGPGWMICGGTGLYIRALLVGLDSSSGADSELRKEGEAILSARGFDQLKEWCEEKRPGIASWLPRGDMENPRRWIRAVERGQLNHEQEIHAPVGVSARIVGLRRTRENLEARIAKRVEQMYIGGLLDEVKSLRDHYRDLSPTAEKAIGYHEAFAVLDGAMSVAEARERTVIRTRQYAKRQMTWFRHQLPTQWIDVGENDAVEVIAEKVCSLWNIHE